MEFSLVFKFLLDTWRTNYLSRVILKLQAVSDALFCQPEIETKSTESALSCVL
jgi:hypothetical protein